METSIETIEMSDNRTLKIYQDDTEDSPRDWDNLGTMVCFHNRYNLGDKHEFSTPDDFMEFLNENDVISLPLYLYDHSGITMRTHRYNKPGSVYWQYPEWDSSMVGYIYVTKETVREQYGWKVITASRLEKIVQHLLNEVKTYDDYLTGNVYGFILECAICEEQIDSCWGFYGDNAIKDIQAEVQDYDCEDCHKIAERLNTVLA